MLTLNKLSERLANGTSTTSTAALMTGSAFLVSTALLLHHLLSANKRPTNSQRRALPCPPTTLPLLGNTIDLITQNDRLHDWLAEICTQFDGQSWSLTGLGLPNIVIVSRPEAFEDVLKTQAHLFGKGPFLKDVMYEVFGEGIGMADGDVWRFQRKTLSKLFALGTWKQSMTKIITTHAVTLDTIFREAVTTQQPLDLAKLLNTFTLEVFTDIGFGVKLGALASKQPHPFERAFNDAMYYTSNRNTTPMWYWKLQRWLNIGNEAKLKRAMALINATTTQVITEAINHATQAEQAKKSSSKSLSSVSPSQHNIMALFLQTSNDEQNKSDDTFRQEVDATVLRDVTIAMLTAGRDTSAEAMAWFFYCLSEHPHVETKIRMEIHSVLPELSVEDSKIKFPPIDVLPELTYLEAALKEAMRLYPPGPIIGRYAYEDTVLYDGTFIPRGTVLMMPSYASMRMTSVWGSDAAEYKPERWIDPQTGKLVQVSPFKFNVFIGGPRQCLGMQLAMNEMVLVTAGLLSRYSVQVVPGQRVTYERSFTLPMKDPFMVRIQSIHKK